MIRIPWRGCLVDMDSKRIPTLIERRGIQRHWGYLIAARHPRQAAIDELATALETEDDPRLLQPIADVAKLLVKEDLVPAGAQRFVFMLAPVLIFAPALLVFAVIPFGEPFDHQRQHADLHMGLDTSGCPMVHGRHLDLGPFEGSEAALDNHQPLVPAGCILQGRISKK